MGGGELWLIGRNIAGATAPLANNRAGAGRCASPDSTRVLAFGLAVKTPADRVRSWGGRSPDAS